MNFIDMLEMSVTNLRKRKLRTALTVLGVVIGVASIVIMMSIGIALKVSMMEEIQQYGSLTNIEVNAPYQAEGTKEADIKRLDDELIETLSALDYVKYVSPRLDMSVQIAVGKYTGYPTLCGVSKEYLQDLNINVGEGALPTGEGSELEVFFGNMCLVQFYDKQFQGYWDTGEVPAIDLMNDNLYYTFSDETPVMDDNGNVIRKPKRYQFQTAGVAAGSIDEYHQYSYQAYCDIDQLKAFLQKAYHGRAIPGQPTTKKGKPYKEIYYSSLVVSCDDMEHVQEVATIIKDMGYNAYSDTEWIESNQKTANMIQMVLGGIGAISLLVAAIGIMNTMMMSIYERTKEIGVMKVLGCDMRNIQMMFLIEAAVIGFGGGVIGIIFSYLVSFALNGIATGAASDMGMSKLSVIPPWLALAGIAFAVVVGMVAGFFPSRRAMRLSPLAAIRND
ncbi:MAG: ABC transporter permease [Lachnospiraceae bacterium]|nr:ABC transporter permease [Lachnospiraceae bacterium]